MNLGLDYDDTFTADPPFWRQFITAAELAGHKVYCTTARHEVPEPYEPQMPASVQFILSSGKWKKEATRAAGVKIDVWIDDSPQMIGPSYMLTWAEEDDIPLVAAMIERAQAAGVLVEVVSAYGQERARGVCTTQAAAAAVYEWDA